LLSFHIHCVSKNNVVSNCCNNFITHRSNPSLKCNDAVAATATVLLA